jgi:predicted ATPase/DNA-binding SARP family transcriptional activator
VTEATDVAFRLLGPVEALRAGEQLPLGGPRQRALLALLLIERGRVVTTDSLADELWAMEPPDGAATTLRSYVSRLRLALGDAAMIHGSSVGYRIDAPPASIDQAVFEETIRAADDDLAQQRVRAARDGFRRALAMWRGRPYEGLSDDGALAAEADRLEELRLHALEERVAADIELGHAAELVDEVEALVRRHPYRERLWRSSMLALYHSGRQADALNAYHRAREMLDEQLGLEPSAEIQALEMAILRHEVPGASRATRRDNVPVALTTFVGRDSEIRDIHRLLADARILTLTGVGGVGKTRLAIEAARGAGPIAEDGVVFVDLAPVTEASGVIRAIARALETREHAGGRELDHVVDELRHSRTLLIMDNCEHLRDQVADVVGPILQSCPDTGVLATSRSPLGIAGEADYPVAPLTEGHSVSLLMDRMRSARQGADFASEGEAATRICRDLDGLPLAIELAAARAKVLSPTEIAARLDDRFRFLVSWRRVASARHQTLRQAIDWSFELLSATDQELFTRLSTFAGGFTLEAAAAFHDGDQGLALDSIDRLVDASLVVVQPAGPETRYRMLETVRQYAEARLDERGDARGARDMHAAYFRALAERAEPELSTGGQAVWFARLDAEHDNLLAALAYVADVADAESLLSFTVSLTRFWYVRGYLGEGRDRLERALAASAGAPAALRRRGLTAAASICLLQGDYEAATRLAETSLVAARETGEDRLVANGLSNLGAIVLAAGDHGRAGSLLTEAVDLARTVGDRRILALSLNNLADHALTTADHERAEPLFAESLELLRELGDTANVARSLFNLGAVALRRDRLAEAGGRFAAGLAAAQAAGDKEDICWCLLGLAALAARRDQGARAAQLIGVVTALLEQMGAVFKPFERTLHDEAQEHARALLGEDEYVAARARGAAMSLDEAVELATTD